jgi:hypothetical protein
MYICQETDPDQLELFESSLPFAGKLDRNNRWIVLAHTVNWRELELSYAKLFATEGRPGLRARYVLGTLILKHQFQVSDEEILQLIIESPYLQYFIGLAQFTTTAPFETSSLARVRERLGEKTFAEFEKTLIATLVEKKLIQPKGLLVDATVYESDIAYPTDCGLLENARQFCVKQIQHLSQVAETKVRTYCRVARRAYLNFTKKKRKTKKQIRRMHKALLQYVRRNIQQVTDLLEKAKALEHALPAVIVKKFETVKTLYEQQKEMYDENKKAIANRIVSLAKPYVRPIVRGKSGKEVEFGAKVELSCVDGYLFADHLSFDNFNESTKFQASVEAFENRFNQPPEYVAMDQIYGSRENRAYLDKKDIPASVKPLGRPKNDPASDSEKRWRKRKQRERNRIEGAIGNSKTNHDLGIIRSKNAKTEKSWIQMALFSRNIMLAVARI